MAVLSSSNTHAYSSAHSSVGRIYIHSQEWLCAIISVSCVQCCLSQLHNLLNINSLLSHNVMKSLNVYQYPDVSTALHDRIYVTYLLHNFFLLLVLLQRAKAVVAKKEEGNAQIKLGNYQAAYDIYSEALEVDEVNVSLNSKLYCNRALAASKVGIHLVCPYNIHNILSYVYVYVCISYTTLESGIN